MKRKINLPAILAFLLMIILSLNDLDASNDFFYPGEELLYEVSFLGIKIGSIKVISEGKDLIDQKEVYKAKAYIDSYSGIPFVDLHTIFYSWMDKSVSHSHKFATNFKENNNWYYEELFFDYNNSLAVTKKWKDKKLVKENSITADKKMVDGLNLLFFPRKFIRLNKSVKVYTHIYDKIENTFINFTGKKEKITIDAVKYPIKTLYIDGVADYKGFYGLNGKFEGWFSDDDAAIPIKAKLKVIIGNIDIELIKWDRGTWKPPVFIN